MREDLRGSDRTNIMSDLRTTRREGGGIKGGSHNREEMAKWRVRVSSGRSETESTGRLLNIIFSARENFSLFRSPTIVAVAVVFSRGQAWDERWRGEFPLSPFPLLRADCVLSRGARRAAPLLVLSFVNLDERSRLGAPPSFLLFFSSSPRCRRPSRRR